MNNKKAKIENLLTKTNQQFVVLDLPQNATRDKLMRQINQPVTNLSADRLNIGKELFKLKIFRLASSGTIVLVAMLLLGGSSVYAATQSLPGDMLYPVNRKIEDFNLALARNQVQRHQIIIIHLQKRATEWEKIKAHNNDVQVLTTQEKLAMENMKAAFAQTINELRAQKQNYLNDNFDQLTEKQQFEQEIIRMNEIMVQHLQFLKNRESEIEQGINSVQDDKKEIEDLVNSMNAQMAEHKQMMQAAQMISQ
ncbi:MAG: DUF5667 domain-containing protein [Patescibacteria group bacterium]